MDFAYVIKEYALPVIIMAAICCVLVGVVKSFIKPKKMGEWLSRLYILLSLVFAFVCVMTYYLGITHGIAWGWGFWKDVTLVYSCSQVLYQLYRKFGGRTLLLKILTAVRSKSSDELGRIIDALVKVIDTEAGELPPLEREKIAAAVAAVDKEKVREVLNISDKK